MTWKMAWDVVARELELTVTKSDLFDRPTNMLGVVDGVSIDVVHFAERGDARARVTGTFPAEGPPAGIVCKRRGVAHWQTAPALHPRHRRVGHWELWAHDVEALDQWLTEDRIAAVGNLDATAELSTKEITVIVNAATDALALLRAIRNLANEVSALAGS